MSTCGPTRCDACFYQLKLSKGILYISNNSVDLKSDFLADVLLQMIHSGAESKRAKCTLHKRRKGAKYRKEILH
jgi:hypothetical protein